MTAEGVHNLQWLQGQYLFLFAGFDRCLDSAVRLISKTLSQRMVDEVEFLRIRK